VAAAHRSGRLDAHTLSKAARSIEALYEELDVIGLDAALARVAGDLAERHALRGYDAVHLASALAIDDRDLVMATWDRDLAAAAAHHRTVVPARGGVTFVSRSGAAPGVAARGAPRPRSRRA
jgi:predicted nucleic acid-binding protein